MERQSFTFTSLNLGALNLEINEHWGFWWTEVYEI